MGDEAQATETEPGIARDGIAPALFAVGMLGLLFVGARADYYVALIEVFFEFWLIVGAALAMIIGLTGLTTAWWSPIARAVFRGRDTGRFDANSTWLFTLGIIASAPAVTCLGAVLWAEGYFGGRAWIDEMARARPFVPVAAIGVPLALAVAWRVCFLPFRRAWLRWVPLSIVLYISVMVLTTFPRGSMLLNAATYGSLCVVALAWAVAVGLGSPRRLGLVPDPDALPDPLDWLTAPRRPY